MSPEPSAAGFRPDPLFVLGAPRSGTTFLQQVLDAHPEVLVTDELRAPSWLVQEAEKLSEGRTVHGNPYPLTLGRPFAEYLLDNAGRILRPFYLRLAKRAGKPAIRYWGDKYPHYDEILHLLPRLFPSAYYVLIHRDLRDTTCSLMQNFGWPAEQAAPFVCLIYDRYVRRADELVGAGVVPAERFLHVNYLDLNTDAVAEAGRLFTALGLGYPEATAARVRELAGIQAHSIRRSDRAPQPFDIAASHQRWERDLTATDLRLVLGAIAGIAEAVAIGNRQQPGAPFTYPAP
jgi:hypothetical protein